MRFLTLLRVRELNYWRRLSHHPFSIYEHLLCARGSGKYGDQIFKKRLPPRKSIKLIDLSIIRVRKYFEGFM